MVMNDDGEVRENIACYDDEGGGEEDTEAFDMSALRHQNHSQSVFVSMTMKVRTDTDRLIQEFIRDRLQKADVDLTAPPYDSLQTYAFEGSGSAAESLSSLDSLTSLTLLSSEQSYDFLTGWGPSFRRLADLYGHRGAGTGSSWTRP